MIPEDQALALIEALADEAEAGIRAEYGMQNGQMSLHPIEQRRFNRDMKVVDEARAFLANYQREQS